MPNIEPIAYIGNDYITKFGIPRQSGIVEGLSSKIVFVPKYRNPNAVKGLDSYDYIWLIWGFSETQTEGFIPMVRPPKLGGNTYLGVFATRSPFRPNSLGMSSVRLTAVEMNEKESPVIYVKGADLMNGTPIYDIKPYIPKSDSHENVRAGFTDTLSLKPLKVEFKDNIALKLDKTKHEILTKILELDPRPSYHSDSNRIYGMEYGEYEVKFLVKDSVLIVLDIFKR